MWFYNNNELEYYPDELFHYGVLGMKRGVHKSTYRTGSDAFVFGAAGGLGAYAISRQVTGGRRYKKEQRSYERYAAKK